MAVSMAKSRSGVTCGSFANTAAASRIALKLRRAEERVVIQYPTRAASFKRLLGSTAGALGFRKAPQPAPVSHKQRDGYDKKDDLSYKTLPSLEAAMGDSVSSQGFVPRAKCGLGRRVRCSTLIGR